MISESCSTVDNSISSGDDANENGLNGHEADDNDDLIGVEWTIGNNVLGKAWLDDDDDNTDVVLLMDKLDNKVIKCSYKTDESVLGLLLEVQKRWYNLRVNTTLNISVNTHSKAEIKKK